MDLERGARSRTVLIGAATVLALIASPAVAERGEVIWKVSSCEETAAILDSGEEGFALLVLAYRCDQATIGGKTITDFAVSEISLMHEDGSSELLRQVTNDRVLHERLRSMGLKAAHLGTIDYQDAGLGQAADITVKFGNVSYGFTGRGNPPVIPPQPTMGGAAYTYDGRKGTIQIQYANEKQTFTPAVLTVQATHDPALQEWLGGETSTGAGIVAAGDWTGTARLID